MAPESKHVILFIVIYEILNKYLYYTCTLTSALDFYTSFSIYFNLRLIKLRSENYQFYYVILSLLFYYIYCLLDKRVTAKFACFSVVDYGNRKDAFEIVFISY